jgi:hypothetical protein
MRGVKCTCNLAADPIRQVDEVVQVYAWFLTGKGSLPAFMHNGHSMEIVQSSICHCQYLNCTIPSFHTIVP